MKKTISLSQRSYKPRQLKDFGKQKSMTIPGQEQSLRQILAQHSRGMPLPEDTKGQYFGDLDVPDFEEMDLTDLMEYTKDLKDDILDMTANLRKSEEQYRLKKHQEGLQTQVDNSKTQMPDNQAVND